MKNQIPGTGKSFSFLLTPIEKAGLLVSLLLLLAAVLSYKSGLSTVLSAILINGGTAAFAAVIGSILKDWRDRIFVGRYGIDHHVIVYIRREASGYPRILENIHSANHVDIMGISLSYFVEYLGDFPQEVARKINTIRILLPKDMKICDDRDAAQGTPKGSLSQNLINCIGILNSVKEKYSKLLDLRFFSIQPYFALIRVDDVVWISQYVTKSGRSCPVLKISRDKSPELFALFEEHFETIWTNSVPEPPEINT